MPSDNLWSEAGALVLRSGAQSRPPPPGQGECRVRQLSGAVGTFAHLPLSVEQFVCARLGLKPAPISSQILSRDRHAEFLQTLALIGTSLDKFATEIRHLQRTEVREVEEPFVEGQKGSSAMPHKRNPVAVNRCQDWRGC